MLCIWLNFTQTLHKNQPTPYYPLNTYKNLHSMSSCCKPIINFPSQPSN